ncbi:MAG: uracil-DNA glycosylase, partial [Elusimicrobia bacterium]|nr:uracil-DNA glycosylase [Elusimicrobiota bacterium]
CRPYLDKQIEIIAPKYIVALGSVAAKSLLESAASLSHLRGRFHDYLPGQAKLIVTYHPAALLRNPNWKKDAWEDMKLLMRTAGIPLPQK